MVMMNYFAQSMEEQLKEKKSLFYSDHLVMLVDSIKFRPLAKKFLFANMVFFNVLDNFWASPPDKITFKKFEFFLVKINCFFDF